MGHILRLLFYVYELFLEACDYWLKIDTFFDEFGSTFVKDVLLFAHVLLALLVAL